MRAAVAAGSLVLLLCWLAILLAATPASATPGVAAFTGNTSGTSTVGGEFHSAGPGGVAVNGATGDVFVSDTNNNRIQQFRSDLSFVRAWGFDVNLPAASPASSSTFEICPVAGNCKAGVSSVNGSASVSTAGEFNRPDALAFNQDTGRLYVGDANFNRVQEFRFDDDADPNNAPLTATTDDDLPRFVRAFGRDVVAGTGGENSPALSEVQALTVDATAGEFTLTFGGLTTGDLAFDAPAATVQAALQGLGSIGTGNVTVTGGPGGTAPYAVTFAGGLASSPQPLLTTADGTTPLSGGSASATVTRTQTGSTGFEICNAAAGSMCKAGVTTGAGGGTLASMAGITVVPSGGTAPNPGNVLVGNAGKLRIEEYTGTGAFVRAFGWNVASGGPGNTGVEFEICRASDFDVCQTGLSGPGAGQFGNAITSVAEDRDGNIYAVEAPPNTTVGNRRVQRLTQFGDAINPQGNFCGVGSYPGELCGTNGDVGQARDNPSEVSVDIDGYVYVVKAVLEGAGNPPLVVARSIKSATGRIWQERILKVDPTANGGDGAVIDTLLANPGDFGAPNDILTDGTINELSALTVDDHEGRLFVAAKSTRARVYRLEEIAGLDAGVSASDIAAGSATLEASITPAATQLPVVTSYRFEYRRAGQVGWLRAPVNDVAIGNGSGAGSPGSCPIGNPPSCEVSQRVDGLAVDRTYEYRVVASTTYQGATFVTEPQEFTTAASAPSSLTGTAVWSGPPASDPTLTFGGRVNPQGERTVYRFEFVTEEDFDESGFERARSVPVAWQEAGRGVSTIDVAGVAEGLDSASEYRYRLVASNSIGTTVGATGVVAPPVAGDRYYELVSEGDAQGADLHRSRLTISDDGERAVFTSVAFGEQQSAPYIVNPSIARRGSDGWTSVAVGPSPERPGGLDGSGDADLTKRLWPGQSELEVAAGRGRWAIRDMNGGLSNASPELAPLDRAGEAGPWEFKGASADLSTFVFALRNPTSGGVRMLADEPLVLGQFFGYSNVYVVRDADTASPSLDVLNRGPGGNVIGGACGARVGTEVIGSNSQPATRAVALNGSSIYFSARAGAAAGAACDFSPVRIFKWVDGASTVAVSESQCDREAGDPGGLCSAAGGDDFYWGASADGSRVFFTSPRQLTDSDTDATSDLYMYDSSPPLVNGLPGPSLVQVSAGEAVPIDHPTVGAGGNVQGVADMAIDGSRAYFVASGRLTADAAAGEPNLYVYERSDAHPEGRIGLVTTLPATDGDVWSATAGSGDRGKPVHALPYEGPDGAPGEGDGRLLVFQSVAALLPGEDLDTSIDTYRYDDTTGALECLTCIGNGEFDAGPYGRQIDLSSADRVQYDRIASSDGGSVVFTTREALTADDLNDAVDVYLWHDGEVTLVSGATGDVGVVGAGRRGGGGVGGPAISPDGRSIFFETRASLLARDRDNGGLDFYVARVDGGFPDIAPPPSCDLAADGCQGGGVDSVSTDTRTQPSIGSDNAKPEARKTLAVAGLSARARRKASRTGVVRLRIRSNRAGVVRLTARGKIGKRMRRVGRASKRLARPGVTTVRIKLNRVALKQLRRGRRLNLSVVVRSPGARPRSVKVSLRRAGR